MKIFFDKFVSKHLGITSHLIILESKVSNLKLKNKIESLKKDTPILITIKSNYKLTKNMSKKLNAKYICDQQIPRRSFCSIYCRHCQINFVG